MSNLENLKNLEKKINSELGTKIKNSKIKHSQIYISIEIGRASCRERV